MARRNGGQKVGGRSQKLSQTLPSFGVGSAFEFKPKQSTLTQELLPPPQWKVAATSTGWVRAASPTADDLLGAALDQVPSMSKTYSDPGLLPKIQWERASTASAKSSDGVTKDNEDQELKSPSFNLQRENHQLKRELEQMEISLLESFRRGDRFMSGGRCNSKGNPPVMQAYLRDKEELRRSRERGAQLEDELRRALSRVEALEIERDMHGDARTMTGELTDQAEAFAEDNKWLKSFAEAQSTRVSEFEEAAEKAEHRAQEEVAASHRAVKEIADQLEKERLEWARAQANFVKVGGAVASTQTCSETVTEEPPRRPSKDTSQAALQTWLARWAGDNPRLTLGLCFHGWYRQASLELRVRAAALANQLQSERDSSIRAHGESSAMLEEERRRLEATLKEKEALDREKKRLTLAGDEAMEMNRGFQKDMDQLWQKTNAAELALSRERRELERVREDSLLQRRQDKSKQQQAVDAAELRIKKAEISCEEARRREADLRAELQQLAAAAQQQGSESLESMEKELKLKCEELEEIKSDRERCKNQRRRVEDRLYKVQLAHDDMKRERDDLLEQLEKLQQTSAKEQLRQMFRLQVLAPSVTVTLAQMKAMDVKAAPSENQIRKVMMERVLPQFAQVLLHDDTKDNTNASAQTSQLVQSVVSGMVSSIEDKLQSLLGTGCVRISMKT